MFKKITSLLLALALTLTCAPALAMAMVTYSSTDDAAAIYSMAAGNGCFYTLQSDSGNTFNLVRTAADTRASETLGSVIYPGDGDNAAAVSGLLDVNPGMIAVDGLFVSEGTLYGVCTATGESWKLLDDSGAFAPVASGLTLDLSGLCADEAGAHSRLYQTALFAQDGYLCWRGLDGNTGAFSGGRISLSTGEKLAFAVPDLYDLCAYKDGKAIGRIFSMTTAIDQNTGTYATASEFGAIDLATGAYEKLGELTSDGTLGVLGISGLQYTAPNDTLYYGNGSVVNGYTIGTGETRVSAYTGEGIMGTMNGRAAASVPGYYAVSSNGLTIYALDTDAVKKGALRIFGEIGSDAHKSFAKNFPDIPTEVAGDYNSGLEALTN
ncbi:MAG: hypothetical protein PHY12_14825, partial [Eubacteriales bacterium]|nr:hypothetical protein [Eubacteriales bacterium]